jgi:type II secretory pathway pseudopilin PulG
LTDGGTVSSTSHASTLQIALELLVVIPIFIAALAIVLASHRTGMDRVRRAEAADADRILAGITMAKHLGDVEIAGDGAQLVRIPAARTPMGG